MTVDLFKPQRRLEVENLFLRPNIASECRSANIVRDHAVILRDHATPGRMRFSERTGR
jgi:hypothetical protein